MKHRTVQFAIAAVLALAPLVASARPVQPHTRTPTVHPHGTTQPHPHDATTHHGQ